MTSRVLTQVLAAQRESPSPGVTMLIGLASFSVFFAVLMIRSRVFRWLYRVTDLPSLDPEPDPEERIDGCGIFGVVGLLGCFMSALIFIWGLVEAAS